VHGELRCPPTQVNVLEIVGSLPRKVDLQQTILVASSPSCGGVLLVRDIARGDDLVCLWCLASLFLLLIMDCACKAPTCTLTKNEHGGVVVRWSERLQCFIFNEVALCTTSSALAIAAADLACTLISLEASVFLSTQWMALEVPLLLHWQLQPPHDSKRANFLFSYQLQYAKAPGGPWARFKKQGGERLLSKSAANCIDPVAKIWTSCVCLERKPLFMLSY